MLGIAIGNEFLDLNPGTTLELESENPFLQFSNEIVGEYSLPFEVKATPNNLRLLQYAGLIQKRIDNKGIEAAIYDGGLQHSTGKLKVEKVGHNLNRTAGAPISLYYLTGISSFYQDTKDVKLRSADFGGNRTFTWDGWNKTGTGFWAHCNKVLLAAPGSYDYAFYPVWNQSFGYGVTNRHTDAEDMPVIMNEVRIYGGVLELNPYTEYLVDNNPLVPFPYLGYVLKKAIEHVGWRIEGDVFSDPDFNKITMINFQVIDYSSINFATSTFYPTISFNLQDHVPDVTIPDLLLQLKNRFGWWYEFDKKGKVIRIRSLKKTAAAEIKNFSAYTNPSITKKVKSEQKIYALKNNFTGSYSDGQPSFENVMLQGSVAHLSDLPTAAESRHAQCYLVIAENNYYICREKEGSQGVFTWQLYTYNVFDYLPDGYTDEITTSATVVGVEKYNSHLDLIPRIDYNVIWNWRAEGSSDWGIILAFYHGIRTSKSGQPYPYASSHIYDSTGTQVSNWALTFECKKYDGTDVGTYAQAYKEILELFKAAEEFELTLQLPKSEYFKLKFSDIISINNVRMYIKTIKATLPYDGSLTVEAIRI